MLGGSLFVQAPAPAHRAAKEDALAKARRFLPS